MLYTLLCGPLAMYSNYFETVSTVTNQTHFQVAIFAFDTVLLYDYYYIMHGSYNMCSTWFLDIRISICYIYYIRIS